MLVRKMLHQKDDVNVFLNIFWVKIGKACEFHFEAYEMVHSLGYSPISSRKVLNLNEIKDIFFVQFMANFTLTNNIAIFTLPGDIPVMHTIFQKL